jgi:Ras-related protein Rab-7A
LSRLSKVRNTGAKRQTAAWERVRLTFDITVIARNALAQEESQDFNPDFPETIPINMNDSNEGCSC